MTFILRSLIKSREKFQYPNITISIGVFLNLIRTISYDSFHGKIVECSRETHISGSCKIGSFTQIGTGAVILPKIGIGDNCIIGAGAVINKHIPLNSVVVGCTW